MSSRAGQRRLFEGGSPISAIRSRSMRAQQHSQPTTSSSFPSESKLVSLPLRLNAFFPLSLTASLNALNLPSPPRCVSTFFALLIVFEPLSGRLRPLNRQRAYSTSVGAPCRSSQYGRVARRQDG